MKLGGRKISTRGKVVSHGLRSNFVAGGGGNSSLSSLTFGILGFSLLATLAGVFVLNSATANAATSAKNLTITATVKDAISLTLSTNAIAFDITPNANGAFNTSSFNATVSTTNQTGYTLYVATTGEDGNGDPTAALEANTTGNTDKIATLTNAVTVPYAAGAYDTTNFAVNRWGFSSSLFGTGANTTFKPFSTTNQKVTPVQSGGTYAEVTSDTNIQNDTTDLTIGSKVDTNLYADTYSNIVTVTAIANAVPYTYTINYNLDGGAFSDSTTYPNPQIEIINDDRYPDIDLYDETPTKTGYDFLGYATSAADQASGIVTYQPGDTVSMDYEDPSLDLYAIWNVHDYTITTNQSSEIATVTVSSNNPAGSNVFRYGDTITITASAPASGYHFTGWTVTDANSNPVAVADSTALTTTFTMPASNVTINAADAANTYTLVYNVNGGNSTAPTGGTVTFGNNYTIANTTPTHANHATGGYTFLGWSTSSSATSASYAKNTAYTVDALATAANVKGTNGGTITLYAIWQKNYNYKITYNANGGSSTPADQTTTSTGNGSFTLAGAISRTGYTFAGWNDGTTTYAVGANYTIAKSDTGSNPITKTLTAQWTLDSYTVTIAIAGSGLSGATSKSINYGGTTTSSITVSSGYKVSSVSCTNGYSATGNGSTSTFTTTISNNSKTGDATCTFTGALNDPCAKYSYSGGIIKLADGNCWTKTAVKTATWANRDGSCPSGMSVPTKAIFDTLVSKYSGGGLYNATGWSGVYWSSTENGSNNAYYLYVYSSNAYVGLSGKGSTFNVVCYGS